MANCSRWKRACPTTSRTCANWGTQTPAHNTVTVDFQSGPQGEDLTAEQTPVIAYFHAGPVVQFAEAHGDKLYAQAPVYRRSVAVVEDIIVDRFRVEGGETHDWIVNHAGPAPAISLPVEPGAFTPEAWIAGGSGKALSATSGELWTARMACEGGDVAPDHAGRAVHPGVCAGDLSIGQRRHHRGLSTDPDPNARAPHGQFALLGGMGQLEGEAQSGVHGRRVESARCPAIGHDGPHLLHRFRAGVLAEFGDGVHFESDAAFTLVRDRDAVTLVHGTTLSIGGSEGSST